MAFNGKSVSLATTELQMVLVLVGAKVNTVRRESLQAAAWGLSDPVTPNALDVALHRLSRKLAKIRAKHKFTNLRGHGYTLSPTFSSADTYKE